MTLKVLGGTDEFHYDANGNLLSDGTRSVTWSSYNYPLEVARGSVSSRFAYAPNRQRYREEQWEGGVLQRRSTAIGQYFEKVEEDGVVTYKHYIRAGAKVVAVHDRTAIGIVSTHYLLRDHLGSVSAIVDEAGDVIRMSFDAFGQRRGNAESVTPWQGVIDPGKLAEIRDITTRGYTGHQMVDSVGLIHMGGRIYDPELGRFLSPDPNVPDPYNTQSYNRYSYVLNNPLSYTDPSGFVPKRESPDMTEEEMDEAEEAMTEEQREELERRTSNGDTVTVRVTYSDGTTGTVTYRPSEATPEPAGSISESGEAENGNSDPAWPTDYGEEGDVTSGYSQNRVDPVTGETSRPHTAIDIRNPEGAPVYAIQDGVVVEVGSSSGAGNYLKVDHANDIQSSYSHTGTSLKPGDVVRRGQIIGHSDGSGRISGPHLHFVIRQRGVRINPCTVVNCP